jgi:predicted metallo-beta-lactamase superfamily hydrolase
VLDCAGKHGARVVTGAELEGRGPLLLEAFRKELHGGAGSGEIRELSAAATVG